MKKLLLLVVIFLIVSICILLFGIPKNDHIEKFLTQAELVEEFVGNKEYFDNLANEMVKNKDAYYIYRKGKSYRIRNEEDKTITLNIDMEEYITYIIKKLEYDSIQRQPDYIDFLFEDNGEFEQHIIYLYTDGIKWYMPISQNKEPIIDNWYYYETVHYHE